LPQSGIPVETLSASSEQFQKTVLVLCGARASALPPIIMKFAGNGFTRSIVVLR
jgi:hypothetical protein